MVQNFLFEYEFEYYANPMEKLFPNGRVSTKEAVVAAALHTYHARTIEVQIKWR